MGVLLFNEGFYFECHEFLEGPWKKEQEEIKPFLHGLILVAVAFYHFEYGTYRGTLSKLEGSLRRLKHYRSRFLGVDVENLIKEVEECKRLLRELGPNNFRSLDKKLVPRILKTR